MNRRAKNNKLTKQDAHWSPGHDAAGWSINLLFLDAYCFALRSFVSRIRCSLDQNGWISPKWKNSGVKQNLRRRRISEMENISEVPILETTRPRHYICQNTRCIVWLLHLERDKYINLQRESWRKRELSDWPMFSYMGAIRSVRRRNHSVLRE